MPPKNVQVVVRCRPINNGERSKGAVSAVECTSERVTVRERNAPSAATKTFTFDRVFGPLSKQIELYRVIVKPVVEEVLEGYNCTVFAYGQTGTGKTFTMIGERSDELKYTWEDDPLAGIIPRSLSHLFDRLETNGCEFSMRVSFLELYNEELFDLLAVGDDHARLRIFDDSSRKGSVVVQGLEEVAVSNKDAVYEIIQRGMQKRATASTLLNAQSSRSHSVFTVTVHMRENSVDGEEMLKIGKLNLVDLAGSENIGRSGAQEKRAREAGSINQSLLTLGRVITALVERTPHIPYRESKLTRILQDSLGGKTKTSIIATITPGSINIEETISTLDYAHRAKNIQNRPEVNQKLCKKALLKEYSDEVERLRRDLQATREKNGCFMDFANYQRMQTTMQQQRDRITEQEASLTTQRQELEKLTDVLQLTEEEMEGLRDLNSDLEAELAKTRRQAEMIQQRLVETEIARREEEDLKEAHMETERKLTDDAKQLIVAADTSVEDVAALHDKVDRMKSCETTHLSVTDQLALAVGDKCDGILEALQIISSDLTRTHGDTKSELTLHADGLASRRQDLQDSVCRHLSRLDLAVSEVRALVFQHAQEERCKLELTGEKARKTGGRVLREMETVAEVVESQVTGRLGDISSKLTADLDCVEETSQLQHNQVVVGMSDVLANQGQMLVDLTSVITKLDEEHEARTKKFREETEKRFEEQEKQLAANRRHFESLLETAAEQYHANSRHIGALVLNLTASFTSSFDKLTTDGHEAAAYTQTTISRAKETCHSLAREIPASESSISSQLRDSRRLIEADFEEIDDHLVAWKQQMEEGANKQEEEMNRFLGHIGGEVAKDMKLRGEDAAKEEKNGVLKVKSLLEGRLKAAAENVQKRHREVANMKEKVMDVLANELPPCPATGTTPARREYLYPRQLARTSPLSRLARFRARMDRTEVEAACRIEEEDAKRRHSSGIGSVCTQNSSRPNSLEGENVIPKEIPVEPVAASKSRATTMKPLKRPFQDRN